MRGGRKRPGEELIERGEVGQDDLAGAFHGEPQSCLVAHAQRLHLTGDAVLVLDLGAVVIDLGLVVVVEVVLGGVVGVRVRGGWVA